MEIFIYFYVEASLCVHAVIAALLNSDKKMFIFQNFFALFWKRLDFLKISNIHRMVQDSFLKLNSYLEAQTDDSP